MSLGLFILGVLLTVFGVYKAISMMFVTYIDTLLLTNKVKDSISYSAGLVTIPLIITAGIVLMYLYAPLAQLAVL